MQRLAKSLLTLAFLTALSSCFNDGADYPALYFGNHNGKGFVPKSLTTTDGRKYLFSVFIPLNYDPAQKYPTIVFLHGVGESGVDGKRQLTVGLAEFVATHPTNFDFICVFPQSTSGWKPDSLDTANALAALDQVEKEYSVDTHRVSLMGFSSGGYGTWAIGAKYHERFSALVPMASSFSDFDDAEKLIHIPIRAFHNGSDPFANAVHDREMSERINAAGGHAEYTEYPVGGHDCWGAAFNNENLFEWLQQQHN